MVMKKAKCAGNCCHISWKGRFVLLGVRDTHNLTMVKTIYHRICLHTTNDIGKPWLWPMQWNIGNVCRVLWRGILACRQKRDIIIEIHNLTCGLWRSYRLIQKGIINVWRYVRLCSSMYVCATMTPSNWCRWHIWHWKSQWPIQICRNLHLWNKNRLRNYNRRCVTTTAVATIIRVNHVQMLFLRTFMFSSPITFWG
jgi:hypothetical protein